MAQATLKELLDRAEAYLKASEVLLATKDKSLVQNALENIHLSVELAMKAVIVKNGGKYQDWGADGHDLSKLCREKFKDGKGSIASEAMSLGSDALNIGLSAWSMDCRYKIMLQFEDMNESISDYKELYRWIKTNFL